MLRYRHRVSKGVDIFVPDPDVLDDVAARLSDQTFVAEPASLKLFLAEGEIDFVASRPVSADAARRETILAREMWVETSAEIVAKKIWYRAARFSARDVVDLAVVAKREPAALLRVEPVLAARRTALLGRLASHQAARREDFAALDLLELRESFDECLEVVREILQPPTRAEQPRAAYRLMPALI